MVNTGHPSRACDQCKARHTKCDERRPQCSRCQRAGRECTGYKSDFDTNFRDETDIVTRRMRAREIYFRSLQIPLPAPYEQQAVALFLESFVLDPPDAGYSKGFLANLLPLLRTAKSNSLLWSTVDAVGLCFLATNTVNQSMALRATRSYLRSLKRLQTTLYHDVDCISTETMISVYLMGLYEMMMPPRATASPWMAHLRGLTAIIKARNTKTGLCLPGTGFFIALNSSLDGSDWAINHNTPVDGCLIDNSENYETIHNCEFVTGHAMKPIADGLSINSSLDNLILRTQPILQTAPSLLQSSHPQAKTKVEHLLAAARSQLSSFRDWPLTRPDYWQPQTIHHQIKASEISQLDIFPGRVDIYPNLCVAAVWNTYRTTLLRLCDLIAQCGQYLETEKAPFRETDEYQALRAQARKTGEDICSSVAYHINDDWLNRITATSLRTPKALGGLFLIWPLYGGSILPIVSDVHRTWMRRKLRSIGISMGLAQAIVLADTVDLRRGTDPYKSLVIASGHLFMWSSSVL